MYSLYFDVSFSVFSLKSLMEAIPQFCISLSVILDWTFFGKVVSLPESDEIMSAQLISLNQILVRLSRTSCYIIKMCL